jgi:GR25 family glycosyltransferase involved in LPS biosynthesis
MSNYFDRSRIIWHYINLDHREDRRQHIAKELAKASLSANRFRAYTLADYKGTPEQVAVMMRTPKTIGNWLSHTGVWETVADTDRIAGVLEDDALLCEDFQSRLAYIDEHMDRPWDIFYLGATYHVNPAVWHKDDIGRDFELTGVKHIHRAYGVFSNQGYLVNGPSVRRLLAMMEQVKHVATGSDHAMIMLQPQLQCYVFTPGMVFQIDGQSDIGSGRTEFSGFLKSLGPHCWANCLEDFDYDSQNWGPGDVAKCGRLEAHVT